MSWVRQYGPHSVLQVHSPAVFSLKVSLREVHWSTGQVYVVPVIRLFVDCKLDGVIHCFLNSGNQGEVMLDITSDLVYHFHSRRMNRSIDNVWCQRQLINYLVYLLFDLLFVLL